EAAAERISDDSEEMENVLTSMDAATVLAGGIADVPTGSGSIPTASPPVDEVNSPSFSGRIVPLFNTMLVQHGEGSGTLTAPHHTPSSKALPPSPTTHSSPTLPPITTTSIPTITPSETIPIRHYTRRDRIAQSFALLTDRATIAKSSILPYNSAPRVTSPAADEGREAAAERISDDSEEMENVLTSMDAATVLAGGIADVPTGSGSIPTASPPADEVPTGSDVVPTASLVFATTTVVTPYRRRKGKEVMVESETLKKQRVQEQVDA
nr:hypothetical protein [Tanacetum cinerariifolium]